MLIKWISQFSNTGWRTNNCFAGSHLACSRLSKAGGERGNKRGGGGTLSVVGGERGKNGGGTVSVIGASEKSGQVREKKGETVSVVGASEKSGRESEESTCHKSFLVLESYTYSYPGRDTV